MKVVWDSKFALIEPVIILGGIYGGIFTPTEAAAVAAVYAFICGVFIFRELNFGNIYKTIAAACSTNGTTMVIIGCATAFYPCADHSADPCYDHTGDPELLYQ